MITIKKHGKIITKQRRWENVIYPHCGCEFTCSQEDIEAVKTRIGEYAFCWVMCPDCEYRIDLKESDSIVSESVVYYGKDKE